MNQTIKLVVATIIIILMVLAAWFVMGKNAADTDVIPAEDYPEPTVTIIRTNTGYEPPIVTIKKGEVVRWQNDSDEFHWPASDLHPTHGIYPEFDPRRPVAPGEGWDFLFDQSGEWRFHDHLRANEVGTVIVLEE